MCVSRRHVISEIISPAGEATSARKALWLGQDPSCVSGAGMLLQVRREFCPRASVQVLEEISKDGHQIRRPI